MFSTLVGRSKGGEIERTDSGDRTVRGRRPGRGRFARVLLGAKGGLIATLVMTAYRLPISRSLPPTANFWATYVGGGDPEEYTVQGLGLHLVYGAVAGGLFGAIVPERGTGPEARREVRDAAWAVAYSAVLSAFGSRVVLGRVLGMDVESDEALVFHLGHLVYGLTLGTWIGARSGR